MAQSLMNAMEKSESVSHLVVSASVPAWPVAH